MDTTLFIKYLIIGYLFGSLPFGLILCRIFGYGNIRKIGSGNIGATNVLRTGNKILAFLTLVLDSTKGVIAVLLTLNFTNDSIIAFWAGVFAIIGHNFPIWLKFKGGKGFATTLGTILVAAPNVGLFMIVSWLLFFKFFKISSLSALISLALAPIFTYVLYGQHWILFPIITISIMGYLRHWQNIIRLLNKTEPKLKRK